MASDGRANRYHWSRDERDRLVRIDYGGDERLSDTGSILIEDISGVDFQDDEDTRETSSEEEDEKEEEDTRPQILKDLDKVDVPTVDQLLGIFDIMVGWSPRVVIRTRKIKYLELRKSAAFRRRGTRILDFDIVKIEMRQGEKGRGVGTRLFKNLMKAAATQGRGVYLEQCITEDSKAWGKRLVERGLVRRMYDYSDENFISIYPITDEMFEG